MKIKLYKQNLYLLICFAVPFLLGGCKTMNPSSMFKTDSDYQFNSFESEKTEYIIRPYDKLSVNIYTNNGMQLIDLTNQSSAKQDYNTYTVNKDGVVKLPTVGMVKVLGLTIQNTEKLLEEKYSQYYKQPFVMVKVTNRRVVVFTAGSTKGTVLNIENEKFTLIEALAKAGGLDDFSKAYRIKLLRGNLKQPKVYMCNISNIEDMQKANLVLQANDIIYVERRGRYVKRTLNEIMPIVTLFNTAVLIWVTVNTFNK